MNEDSSTQPSLKRGPPHKQPVTPVHPSTHINIQLHQLFKNTDTYCKFKQCGRNAMMSSTINAHTTSTSSANSTMEGGGNDKCTSDYFSDDEVDLNQFVPNEARTALTTVGK